MSVVTRFAPSPTGFLHIGGARTALFNWLYARRHGGTFLLRIEDTDRARSTEAAVNAIIEGLSWLELDWDGEPISQFARRERHASVAHELLQQGKAYRCYCTPAELEEMRERARAEGRPVRYDGRWRDRDPSEAPPDVQPAIRMRAPQDGETVIDDQVQGSVTIHNSQLDDMVLLRGDGTPTYMLSVVVDDHDMNVTHIIRGDDHLTNAFRQSQLYRLLQWQAPIFAHIPLIHGSDGAKLSKRHGALGVDAYRDMGYLPAAMRNYLLRLGWSRGDAEIISTDQAKAWFDLEGIGRSPARLDLVKLNNLNGHYMREADDEDLRARVEPMFETKLGRGLAPEERALLLRAMHGLKQRAKTLVELADNAMFFLHRRPLALDQKAEQLLTPEVRETLGKLAERLSALEPFSGSEIEKAVREFADEHGVKLGAIAQPLRAALTGSSTSPPIFEVAEILGKPETVGRIVDVASRQAVR